MGFRSGAFATVWSVEEKGKMIKARISTSRKNKDTGEYEQDFSGFCTFVGSAKADASRLRERDRIKLGGVDVTTTYDKERNREYVNYTVFDFEMEESGRGSNGGGNSRRTPTSNRRAEEPVSNPVEGDVDEEELPF